MAGVHGVANRSDHHQIPTLNRFALDWQRSTSAKSYALSDRQVTLSSTFSDADKIPLRPIPWMFIAPGALLALLAAAALLPARRPAASEAFDRRAVPAS